MTSSGCQRYLRNIFFKSTKKGVKKMSEFEKKVRHALIDRNMSMTDLASELGISVSYLYELIKGTRKAEDQIARIKSFLGLTDEDDEQIINSTDCKSDECQ